MSFKFYGSFISRHSILKQQPKSSLFASYNGLFGVFSTYYSYAWPNGHKIKSIHHGGTETRRKNQKQKDLLEVDFEGFGLYRFYLYRFLAFPPCLRVSVVRFFGLLSFDFLRSKKKSPYGLFLFKAAKTSDATSSYQSRWCNS